MNEATIPGISSQFWVNQNSYEDPSNRTRASVFDIKQHERMERLWAKAGLLGNATQCVPTVVHVYPAYNSAHNSACNPAVLSWHDLICEDVPDADESAIITRRQEMGGELREYGQLPVGWDDDGGHAPAVDDINHALEFMRHIPNEGILSARAMVAGDGDVGFCWEQEEYYLEVGFSDGEISFYGEFPKGGEVKGCEKFSRRIPGELQSFMSRVFAK